MLEIVDHDKNICPKILVIGVGGGGNNAVDRMIDAGLSGVTFASINTDQAVLQNSKAEIKLQIGEKILKGYGAGADPSLGEAAAIENEDNIKEIISEMDMVIITCGMGGGTGTGVTPFIAKCCKDAGVLTIGVVTLPFTFENKPRMVAAESGITKLKENVDTLLVIPNDKLLNITDRQLKLEDAFVLADSVLKYSIEGITNIVYNLGAVNIDFNDLRTTLTNKGIGHLGIGTVDADVSILEAVKQAVNSPLLDTSIAGAEMILLNTSGNVTLLALNEAASYLRELAGENVNIIWGTVSEKDNIADNITVTLIATGMPEKAKKLEMNVQRDWNNKKNNSQVSNSKSSISENIKNTQFDKKLHRERKEVEIPIFLRNYNSF